MVSTAEEEWSIISSSDYEDDLGSSHSVSHQSGARSKQEKQENNERNERKEIAEKQESNENQAVDLAACSVSTVRANAEFEISTEADLRVNSIPVCATPSEVAPVLGLGVASKKGANGARTERAFVCAEKPTLASLEPPLPWAVDRVGHYLYETHTAIKVKLRQIFGPPLALLHGRFRLLSLSLSCALCKATGCIVAVLEGQQQLLLYYVIVAFLTAWVGVICGTDVFISWSLHKRHARNPLVLAWESISREFSDLTFDTRGINVWIHKTSIWLSTFKGACYNKASDVVKLALYENYRRERSWYNKFLYHAPAEKLRFSKFMTSINRNVHTHLHRLGFLLQKLRASPHIAALFDHLLVECISNLWNSVRDRIHQSMNHAKLLTRVDQWKRSLILLGKQFHIIFKVVATKNWRNLQLMTRIGLNAGTEMLRISFRSAKAWVSAMTSNEVKEALAHKSRELAGIVKRDFGRVSSQIFQWCDSFHSLSTEYHAWVDTVEKREHLLRTFKAASQTGLELFNRRLQLAAIDAYRLFMNTTVTSS